MCVISQFYKHTASKTESVYKARGKANFSSITPINHTEGYHRGSVTNIEPVNALTPTIWKPTNLTALDIGGMKERTRVWLGPATCRVCLRLHFSKVPIADAAVERWTAMRNRCTGTACFLVEALEIMVRRPWIRRNPSRRRTPRLLRIRRSRGAYLEANVAMESKSTFLGSGKFVCNGRLERLPSLSFLTDL